MVLQVYRQLVLQLVQVAVVHLNAAAQVERLVKMQARNQVAKLSHERRCAMSSTICKRHNSVAQLFLTAMEKLRFVCDVDLHWLTLPTRLAQIQQH
jgi:hypothetical protein